MHFTTFHYTNNAGVFVGDYQVAWVATDLYHFCLINDTPGPYKDSVLAHAEVLIPALLQSDTTRTIDNSRFIIDNGNADPNHRFIEYYLPYRGNRTAGLRMRRKSLTFIKAIAAHARHFS